MKIFSIADKDLIEAHFRKNTELNVYSLGDLDDFFFEQTMWYAAGSDERIKEIILLYKGFNPPTLIAVTGRDPEYLTEFISKVKAQLPENLYAHLTPGVIKAFGKDRIKINHGLHFKMSLKNRVLLLENQNDSIRRLGEGDIKQIKDLYDRSYPENFFDRRMLVTGKYFGYFENSKLLAIAGIHVYSEKYRVAALGNITTDAEYRGRSIAKKLTSVLCKDLLKTVDSIGLNVFTGNLQAINCYRKIGFEVIGEYEEYLLG